MSAILSSHVSKLRAMSGRYGDRLLDGIEMEYNKLRVADNEKFNNKLEHFSSALRNMELNRYTDVLPNEHSRIKLHTFEKSNDYINANFIPSTQLGSRTSYIVTQGPLDKTIGDFWNMIWQYDVPVVVMLASEIETGRIKCAKYWLDDGFKSFPLRSAVRVEGALTVHHVSTQNPSRDIILRKVKLESQNDEKSVALLQYTGWPDHGVPSSTESFNQVLKVANELMTGREDKPMVVHCSAGIGRSGTFCAADSILQRMRDHMKRKLDPSTFEWNVMETVAILRTYRSRMVQTKSQYDFLYDVLISQAESEGF
ncbi:PTPN18 [Acrasis kona]|uniref:PTPN18 n=1 Tax=Acrasis kona TaxID=1008807 RepID=A0AAW2ZKB9_9EUKA